MSKNKAASDEHLQGTEPDEQLRDHVDVLERWADAEICSWLLQGFATGRFAEIVMLPEPSPPVQIKRLARLCIPATQEALKRGVTRAILEWTPDSHPYSVFSELTRTAAYLRASQSVPHIASHLLSPAFQCARNEEMEDAAQIAVAVLHGFAPMEAVRSAFLRLYGSEHFEIYGAQIFVALCECAPDNFAQYVPRFLDVLKRYPDEFRLDMVMAEFQKVVGEEYVQEEMVDLIRNSNPFMLLIHKYTHYRLEQGRIRRSRMPKGNSRRSPDVLRTLELFNFQQELVERVGVEESIQQDIEILRGQAQLNGASP